MAEPHGNSHGAPFALKVVDGLRLPIEVRRALMPGGSLRDSDGHARVLPRFFYEVPDWRAAEGAHLTPNFSLWEFLDTDIREAEALRGFPRYVPCAVTLLALALQRLRDAAGASVHVAANGGYRSPRHALTWRASPHCWATAADVHRVGDTRLDTPEAIERFALLARKSLAGVYTHPAGSGPDQTDDHLHLDLGQVVAVPRHVRVDSGVLAEIAS